MNKIDPANIVGEIPNLQGKELKRLVVQEFWYDSQLEEDANVIYLQIGDVWHKLYFDWGKIFWKKTKEQEIKIEPFEDDSGIQNQFLLRDIGKEMNLEGKIIKAIEMDADSDSAKVKIIFGCGSTIYFESIGDSTTLRTEPAAGENASRPTA